MDIFNFLKVKFLFLWKNIRKKKIDSCDFTSFFGLDFLDFLLKLFVYIICLHFSALPPQLSPARSMAQLKNNDTATKNREIESKSKSPYTFFTVDSDDDFDPYGSDVPSDVETKRDLLLSHSLGKS